jgi:hypothetical protein
LDVDQVVARIETILQEAGGGPAEELVRMLMQLYGEGLERIVEVVRGTEFEYRLGQDKLVGSLLLLHGLHPLDAETRLRTTMERLERSFDAHFRLESIEQQIARIRVEKNGSPLPHGIAAVIERAALEAAPELEAVDLQGLPAEPLVQIAPMP